MFRDLKEYQQIQKIYEERVCITEEERYITKELKETFTEDEINFIVENTEEVFAEIGNQLIQEGTEITEETIDEMAKVVAKAAVPLATRMAKAGAKLQKSAGGLIKKGVGFVKKNAGKLATAVGAGGVGAAIGAATTNNANKNKAKDDAAIKKGIEDAKKTGIPNNTAVQGGAMSQKAREQAAFNRGERKARKDLKDPTLNDNMKKKTETETKPKKMSSIEKKNRARFGDKRVDMLKAKQTDFKAMRKGTMSKDDFIKKYPKSITAQKAKGLRDHVEKDAYDIVLEYLLSSQQAATIEEANHIMIEMDAKTIQSIVAE